MRQRANPSATLRVRTASVSASAVPHDTSTRHVDRADEEVLLSPSAAEDPTAARIAHPVSAETSSEKAGFVVYAGSLTAWWLYLAWAVLPDRYLRWLGIEWYPNREWAILLPAWSLVAVVFVYIAYFALNLFNTQTLDSLTILSDTCAHIPPPKPAHAESAQSAEEHIPPLYDLPPGMINRALFDRKLLD